MLWPPSQPLPPTPHPRPIPTPLSPGRPLGQSWGGLALNEKGDFWGLWSHSQKRHFAAAVKAGSSPNQTRFPCHPVVAKWSTKMQMEGLALLLVLGPLFPGLSLLPPSGSPIHPSPAPSSTRPRTHTASPAAPSPRSSVPQLSEEAGPKIQVQGWSLSLESSQP